MIVSFFLGALGGAFMVTALVLSLWLNEKPDVPELVLAIDGDKLNMDTLRFGDWSEVCFFAPYSSPSDIKDMVGAPETESINSRAIVLENHTLAAFKFPSGSVEFFDIPRSNVDFTKVAGACYPRRDARFSVDVAGGRYARRA